MVVSRPASCPFSASGQSRPRPCMTGSRGYHNHIAANVPRMRPTVIGPAFVPRIGALVVGMVTDSMLPNGVGVVRVRHLVNIISSGGPLVWQRSC